jgi:hypothetical protein
MRAGKSEVTKWLRCWNDIQAALDAIQAAPEPDPREWKVYLGPRAAQLAIEAGIFRPEDVVVTQPIPTDYHPH